MIGRLLNPQGIAGFVVAIALAVLLTVQKVETSHWRKQSNQFEQLYRGEQSAFAGTVANYRSAADQARAADQANADRVISQQRAINERTANDFQVRLADARARADRLRLQSQSPGANPGNRPDAPVSGLSAAAGGAAQGADPDRLSRSDALIATEQAIQLDELIGWIRRQHAIERSTGDPGAQPVPVGSH